MTDLEQYRLAVQRLQFVEREKRAMRERIKELDEAAADALEEIQEALGEEGDGYLDGKMVASKKVIATTRLDQKTLRDRFPQIRDVCMIRSSYTKFEIHP